MTALVKTSNTKSTKTKPKPKPKKSTQTITIEDDGESDLSWLWLLLTIGAAGGIAGAIGWASARRKENEASEEGGAPSSTPTPAQGPRSLAEIAASLRAEYLKIDGCVVGWRLGDSSRTGLMSHYVDFFAPAIADAQVKGASSIDEITAHVASVLVPGCPWPPLALMLIDFEAALAGKLDGFVAKQQWAVTQAIGAVQVYLAIRLLVSTVLAQGRRG